VQDARRKRDRGDEEPGTTSDAVEESVDYGGEGFEALGYSTLHLFAGLTTRDEVRLRPQKLEYSKTDRP
jgi:hypothetical protein